MKTCIIVSPYFPPATLAGVHRARHLAKYLPAFGWRPIIVRLDERHYSEPIDPALASLVPGSVDQVRTQAFSTGFARLFGIGDIGLRGFFGFRAALDALAKTERIDAVLITGSPFYPLLLARHVRENLRISPILDFQDPWVSGEGSRCPRWTKGWAAHKLAVMLEPHAVRHAEFITSVSDRQNDEMAARYSFLDRQRMAAIPIGGDPEDFMSLREHPPTGLQVRLSPGVKQIVYVGTFLPRAAPLVRVLFRALGLLRKTLPNLVSTLRLTFVGTSNQPSGIGGGRVKPIAEAEGVSDLVDEHPQRVPFLEALSLLANADGLIMIGSDEPHYTASKIYPCLMADRPFISIFHRASSAHSILMQAGGGIALAFSDEHDLDLLVPSAMEALEKIATGTASIGTIDPASFAQFTARAVAGRFAQILEEVSTGPTRNPARSRASGIWGI